VFEGPYQGWCKGSGCGDTRKGFVGVIRQQSHPAPGLKILNGHGGIIEEELMVDVALLILAGTDVVTALLRIGGDQLCDNHHFSTNGIHEIL
jgi:hypothetical protein